MTKTYKIGDKAFRKKEHHTWIEWIPFVVNSSYLWVIKQFPEDFKKDPTND